VACEISSGDELLLSELLFNRVFNELTPEQCAALLSCFVFEEKSNQETHLKDDLAKPFRELQSQAKLIAKISAESKLPVTEDEYVQKFKPQLMDVVHEWSKGASFSQIWWVFAPVNAKPRRLLILP
jgi:ATP-dependent RNA helicase DOB1